MEVRSDDVREMWVRWGARRVDGNVVVERLRQGDVGRRIMGRRLLID